MHQLNPSFTGRQPHVHHIIAHAEQPDLLPQLTHQHSDLHEITLVLSGGAQYAADCCHYEAAAGDVIFSRANMRHTLLPRPALRHCTILFSHLPYAASAEEFLPSGIYHCGDIFPELQRIAELLCACAAQQPQAVLGHLLSAMLHICAGAEPAAPLRRIDQTSPAYAMSAFIDTHYSEDICLSNIADAASITASHAIHVFKPVFGTSPVQYLNSRRIGQAQAALLSTGLHASQIASEIGIGNINYFYTVFKRLVGLSPISYRAHFEKHMHHCIPAKT